MVDPYQMFGQTAELTVSEQPEPYKSAILAAGVHFKYFSKSTSKLSIERLVSR